MKRSIWYILCILVLGSMFSVCYYLSYRSALKKLRQQEKQQELNLVMDYGEQQAENMFAALTGTAAGDSGKNNTLENADNPGSTGAVGTGQPAPDDEGNAEQPDNRAEEAVPADTIQEAHILPGTKIFVESYEVTTGEFTVEERQPDSIIVGMTREQLLDYLADELDHMSVTEYEKGLYANELITFSENKVIVRKTYDMERVDFLYYLAVKNGEVVVYYSDMKTVYEYTGIRAMDLGEEERLLLLEGIRIKTAEELFSLLESYSS